MPSTSFLPGYSTREIARLLGLSEARVRGFVRSGFLSPRRGPRRELRFSFQDLVVLRAAKGLVEARIPPRRIQRALAKLAHDLPQGRSLAALRIAAEGSEIVVRVEGDTWNPESGQRILDFEVSDLASQVTPLSIQTVREARDRSDLSAEDWFVLALELEATAPEKASEAYHRALELEPEHPDAHLNLGRLLHESGEVEEAKGHYRRAAASRPTDATAVFNLGVALQDSGRPADAEQAYRQALTIDPYYADAYYNLAKVYEDLGRPAAAIQSLKGYKRLAPPSKNR